MAKGSLKKKILAVLLVLVVLAGVAGYIFYRAFYYPSIKFDEKSRIVFIHTGWDFNRTFTMLMNRRVVRNPRAFKLLAGLKDYKTHVKPGRYKIMSGMSNDELINMLLAGKQEPESISLYNIRFKEELIDILSGKLETDSTSIAACFTDAALKKYGFNGTNIVAMFMPGTSQLLWTDTPQEYLDRVHNDYENFWTEERRKKAAAIPLKPLQVSTLASIVQGEQSQNNDEKKIIAGLYINRLKRDIPLQSDPTLVFAKGDFTIRRVLDKDKEINSPYNTYMYAGLPPGPIIMPDTSSVSAVLNYQKNDYIYMCAEADFSGRHHFSTKLGEQEEYAHKYQQALNKREINR